VFVCVFYASVYAFVSVEVIILYSISRISSCISRLILFFSSYIHLSKHSFFIFKLPCIIFLHFQSDTGTHQPQALFKSAHRENSDCETKMGDGLHEFAGFIVVFFIILFHQHFFAVNKHRRMG
jgi:hypothetical protein